MVNWNGDKDAILLRGIFEVLDLKISMALCQKLADKIGEGCTAKAVSHRMNNLKNRGRPSGSTPSSTPRKAPTSSGGSRPRKNKNIEYDGPMDIKSPTLGRKRGRKAEALGDEIIIEIDDEDGPTTSKKLKMKKEEEDDDPVVILDKDSGLEGFNASEGDDEDEGDEFV
ncbi:hypothetical protein K505DRAFT_365739 [Melanomma pulvis-pyrius CBS 109.77]|uniref:Uncharacterized protein n=1 Tax=Melanomma pulvis-pyrius CBS 109.77 TaxID=1314802 RepID=A0A6A6WZD8_9PLEO|nr:hypothetical protein K505DRAFT_365739 [Melanomma pulvis-pyrius CBS 109.77]